MSSNSSGLPFENWVRSTSVPRSPLPPGRRRHRRAEQDHRISSCPHFREGCRVSLTSRVTARCLCCSQGEPTGRRGQGHLTGYSDSFPAAQRRDDTEADGLEAAENEDNILISAA